MARLPRLVFPGLPHHVTQRGNGRGKTFFEEADYALYLDLLAQASERAKVEVWAYCLMPNHIHAVVVPSDEDGLRRTFGELHRRYTGFINARHRRPARASPLPLQETCRISHVMRVTAPARLCLSVHTRARPARRPAKALFASTEKKALFRAR
jgi:putative transposase